MFLQARPYIPDKTFVYSFLYTIFLSILILNGIIAPFGGRIWSNSFEGQDIFRFCCFIYTVISSKVLDILRGGNMKKGDLPMHKGIFDLRRINLPNIPNSTEVHKIMGKSRFQ